MFIFHGGEGVPFIRGFMVFEAPPTAFCTHVSHNGISILCIIEHCPYQTNKYSVLSTQKNKKVFIDYVFYK